MKFPHIAAIHTATGSHALSLAVARSSWARFHGLMLRGKLATEPTPQGLLITRCPSVHTLFMRYAIDVVYLSKTQNKTQDKTHRTEPNVYTVTHLSPNLKPWRASIGKSYRVLSDTESPIPFDPPFDTPVQQTVLKSAHALELPAGSIAALGIAPGDTLSLAP